MNNRRAGRRWLLASTALLLLLGAGIAAAQSATTGLVPAWRCSSGGVIASGFEDESAPLRPSNGSGGETEAVLRQIDVPGFGVSNFYLYVPTSYDPAQPVPLVVVLHGAAGPGAADTAASGTRAFWWNTAIQHGFILLVPTGHSPQGSWIIPDSYDLIDAGIADTFARYNIDRNRVYAWGFSAGANLLHALALGRSDKFAAYAVHAGSLQRAAGVNAPLQAVRKPPLELWVGSGDSVYLPEMTADRSRFVAAGWVLGDTLGFTTFNGGHSFDSSHFSQIWPRWCRYAVVPGD